MVKPKTPAEGKKSRAIGTAEKAARRSAVRKSGRIKSMLGGKIKWGEAALFGLLGYEMGNVFQGTGIPEYLYSKYPMFAEAVNGSTAKDSGDFLNKLLGLGTGGKVLYDGLVDGKVKDADLSILLPYTLGTVFDANKGKSSNTGGRW